MLQKTRFLLQRFVNLTYEKSGQLADVLQRKLPFNGSFSESLDQSFLVQFCQSCTTTNEVRFCLLLCVLFQIKIVNTRKLRVWEKEVKHMKISLTEQKRFSGVFVSKIC